MSTLHSGTDISREDKRNETAASGQETLAYRYRLYRLGMLLLVLLLSIAFHYQTYASMVQIWLRSDTFLHCALIFPISGFLIWQRRRQLLTTAVKPFYPGLFAVLVTSLLWLLCEHLGIQVGKQLFAVALLPLLTLSVAGPDFSRTIAFPLAYLFFAVPFGEAAIPYLVDFTAFFTVEALQLSGIPVLRDGSFFSIPVGNFEVAKACSGIRYFLASVSLGTLYGYLIFRSAVKRFAFFLFAMILPIVANGLRAFLIVLLAHYSDMKIAVGVDHLIFGWIFFGLIMIFMFWIGDRYRDRATLQSMERELARTPKVDDSHPSRLVLVMLASLGIVIIGPGLATVASEIRPASSPKPGLPLMTGTWRLSGTLAESWQPAYIGATHELVGNYSSSAGAAVDLYLIRYDTQQQGAELANSMNAVADPDLWNFRPAQQVKVIGSDRGSVEVRETLLHQDGRRRLVWYWYEVGGVRVDDTLEIKLREASEVLRLRAPVAAAIFVSAPLSGDLAAARHLLEMFLSESISSIRECLYMGADWPRQCVLADSSLQSQQSSEHTFP